MTNARAWRTRGYRQLVGHILGHAPLPALLFLAALIGGALLALVAHFLPLYLHELANLCRRSWSVLLLHVPALGALAPLLLLTGVLLWGAGLLVRQQVATRRFLAHLHARLLPAPATLHPLLVELRLVGRLHIIRDESALAFCYGLRRPRVCVTTGMLALLTPQEQRAMLAHEAHHLHRRDPLRKLLIDALAAGLRFIPLVPLLHRAYQVSQEVAADQAAIAFCGGPGALAGALVKLLQQDERVVLPPTAMGLDGTLDARLKHLLGQPVPLPDVTGRVLLLSLVTVAGVLLASYAAHSVMYTMPPGASECLVAQRW